MLGANESRIEGTLVRRRDGEEDQLLVLYDKLARAMWEQRAASLEIRNGDRIILIRAIRERILGPSASATATTTTLVGRRKVEHDAWTVARAKEAVGGRNTNP